ncbi:SRPBCC family protein [Flavisolibacter nicotianae]|uniref:SRPBCC family protein n=1 Tax=Flavisolibacter nicotianae TaxID=2364882 RepID=UPI000EADB038|nr:SRPBCC family protein [Flavisolibacter nicotianae]
MSKVYVLYSRQHVPASLDAVWTFFSDANNLLAVTPPGLNLKVTNEVYGKTVYAGQVMTYTVKPLLGIPLAWMTEITHVVEKKYFVDEQRKGPYTLWHHQHHFNAVDGGVEMTDLVHYRLPFGPLGSLVHSLVVKKELEKIFTYRYQKIVELFGGWKGERMEILIQ